MSLRSSGPGLVHRASHGTDDEAQSALLRNAAGVQERAGNSKVFSVGGKHGAT